jgi:SAM-dependent methyltransferase
MRGGEDYFREQEGQEARALRAEWMADHLAAYRPASILEVGCGYGKLLRALRQRIDIPLVGVDFSLTQLSYAKRFLEGLGGTETLLASGDRLPFPDRSFDMVVTSAVILHNPPEVAERIRREVLRVARRYAAHNEEMGVSYNRYGYDTVAWYRQRGIPLAEAGPIPMDPNPRTSQFCVASLERPALPRWDRSGVAWSRLSEEIPADYREREDVTTPSETFLEFKAFQVVEKR